MNNITKKNIEEWRMLRSMADERKSYYYQGDGSESLIPHTINLAVNNSCFMKCAMCDVGQANAKKGSGDQDLFFNSRNTGQPGEQTLSTPVIKKLVDDVVPYKPIIRANFLEPLTRHDIVDIASHVVSRGLHFYVISNGYHLAEKARDLVRAGTRCIRISMDGMRETHDMVRGIPGSFDRSIEGLRIVVDEMKKSNLTYPLVGVAFTISNHNYGALLEFYQTLEREGLVRDVYVAFIHMKYVTSVEALRQNEMYPDFAHLSSSSLAGADPSKIDTDELWQQIEAVRKAYPNGTEYKNHFLPVFNDKNEMMRWYDGKTFLYPGTSCYVPWTVAQVYYNGDVGVNGRCVSPFFGNILEKSFPEVWNSEEAKAFRRSVKADSNMPACARCNRHFHKSPD